jgi:hypothetical protein
MMELDVEIEEDGGEDPMHNIEADDDNADDDDDDEDDEDDDM